MSETPLTTPAALPSKAKVILTSLIDFGLDLLLPTAIFALLAPTGLSAALRLTIGGFFVAAKACAGRVFAPDEPGHATFKRSFGVGVLIAVACTVVTVATNRAGGSDQMAILLGTGILVVVQGIHLVREWRTLDGFALLVLVELAATVVLTSISNDPRFILIRPSFYTAIAGVYALATVWTARPLMMQVTKPMAAAGDPVKAEAFERAARESLRFRRTEQAMTVGVAIVLIAEAVLRVFVVMSHPGSSIVVASLQSHVPGIVLFAIYFAVMKLVLIPRARQEVEAFLPAKNPRS
jgi:hypothetical protein